VYIGRDLSIKYIRGEDLGLSLGFCSCLQKEKANEKAEEEMIKIILGQVAFSVMYQFVISETGHLLNNSDNRWKD